MDRCKKLIMERFGSEIPQEHGVVIIRRYPDELLRWGKAIKISAMIELDMILDRHCMGAAIVYEHEWVFVLYRKGDELRAEQYVGKPIFKQLSEYYKPGEC